MLVREGNKIRVCNKERKDEFFKGLIGKVNATKKDADNLVDGLKQQIGKGSMDIEPNKYGFTIYLYTSDDKNNYFIRIGERAKDKICVSLKKDGKDGGEIKGLRLNTNKIIEAIFKLLEKNGADIGKLEATSRVKDRAYRLARDKTEREWEAEKEKERELLKKIRAQKEQDAQKKGGSTSYSRRDWVDINPVGNAWLIDPGRL